MKILRSIGLILVLCVALSAFFACNEETPPPAVSDEIIVPAEEQNFFCEWMKYLKPETRLVDIVMAGSHDSGTKDIGGSDYADKYAETQSADIYEQLRAGVRYLDLRVAYSNKTIDGELKTVLQISHGIAKFGMSAEDALRQIAKFCEEYPTEYLVLDFQEIESGAEQEVSELVESILNVGKATPKSKTLSNLTVGEVRESGENYMIAWNPSQPSKDYLWGRYRAIDSYYHEPSHCGEAPALVENNFERQYLYRWQNTFFVLQSQLTMGIMCEENRPDGYVYNTYKSIHEMEQASQATFDAYLVDLTKADYADRLEDTNIIMRDYVTEGDKIKLITALNLSKSQVTETNVELFAKMTKPTA